MVYYFYSGLYQVFLIIVRWEDSVKKFTMKTRIYIERTKKFGSHQEFYFYGNLFLAVFPSSRLSVKNNCEVTGVSRQ